MVKERKAKRVYDPDENHVGYQLLSESPKPSIARESNPSSAAFSSEEVAAIAGLHGESRTETLDERRKLSRLNRGLREMDLVESARRKFEVYQSVH
jgi:hypothetical protein